MHTPLFPYRFRAIGWPLLAVGIFTGALNLFADFELTWLNIKIPAVLNDRPLSHLFAQPAEAENKLWRDENMSNELFALLTIIGGLFVGFSKEKIEDEYHNQLRLSALVWAVYANAAITIAGLLLLYSLDFLLFAMINLFTVLLLFIMRYQYLLYKVRRLHEE